LANCPIFLCEHFNVLSSTATCVAAALPSSAHTYRLLIFKEPSPPHASLAALRCADQRCVHQRHKYQMGSASLNSSKDFVEAAKNSFRFALRREVVFLLGATYTRWVPPREFQVKNPRKNHSVLRPLSSREALISERFFVRVSRREPNYSKGSGMLQAPFSDRY
jgi:hypothetical protein